MTETVVISLLTSVGANGLIAFVFEKWFEHQYEKKLAEHTARLSLSNDREVAELKHKLELAAAERNFRFSRVFDRTADTIEKTYKQLLELQNAVEDCTYAAGGTSRQSFAELATAMNDRPYDLFLRSIGWARFLYPRGRVKKFGFSQTPLTIWQ